MNTRQFTINVNLQLFNNAENVLDDIGLDVHTATTMFLKRVVKEGGIAFLIQNTKMPDLTTASISEEKPVEETIFITEKRDEPVESPTTSTIPRNNNEITEEMRDYIWSVFCQNKYASYSDYQQLAKDVHQEINMNQSSAYIYFTMLSNFISGKSNTRTMKYADLVYYIKRILQEFPRSEFAATLKSLEDSVPYWQTHLLGRFGDKVLALVNQHKPFLK